MGNFERLHSALLCRVVRAVSLAVLILAGSVPPLFPLQAQPTERMSFALAADPAMRFGEVATQGYPNIYATGPIAEGDADRFQAFVKAHKLEAAQVVFNSPGGALLEGVKLGRVIRSLGFATGVAAQDAVGGPRSKAICASACAYAFAGGVLRYVSDEARLGVHQFRSSLGAGVSEGDAQILSGFLVQYLDEMGVDAKAFSVASASSPDEIIWLTAADAKALHFTYTGVSPTTAEVRIADMRPFLRLDQQKPGVELRILILCWNKNLSMQAGIVTDPQGARNLADKEWLKRSYLEIDGHEAWVVNGTSGAMPNDSTVWLERALTKQQADALLTAKDIGIWLDGFGAVRAGGTMDLRRVHDVMRNYFTQCYAS